MSHHDFSTVIYQRDLSASNIITPRLITYLPQRYSFANFGGPEKCTLTCRGQHLPALFELLECLRCPLEIYDSAGVLCWWGYVAQATINTGRFQVGVSLDTLYNNVAVAYSYVAPGTATVGQRKTTAYSSDADSTAEYGTKDLLLSLGGATDEQALQVRAAVLALYRYPRVIWSPATSAIGAQLEARGWWTTLGWRNYLKATTASVETTTQIANAISTAGQFLAGTILETASSGVSTSEYRDGDTSARAEIEELLKSGTTDNIRLASWVAPDRMVRLYTERSDDSALDTEGRLYDAYGNRRPKQTCPAGLWLKLNNVLPASVDVSKLSNPARMFVERAEYTAAGDTYLPYARGVPSPWEIGKLFVP